MVTKRDTLLPRNCTRDEAVTRLNRALTHQNYKVARRMAMECLAYDSSARQQFTFRWLMSHGDKMLLCIAIYAGTESPTSADKEDKEIAHELWMHVTGHIPRTTNLDIAGPLYQLARIYLSRRDENRAAYALYCALPYRAKTLQNRDDHNTLVTELESFARYKHSNLRVG